MTGSLWLPFDDVSGASIDFDIAADFLDLSAFFAADSTAHASDLVNQSGLGSEKDHADLDEGWKSGEDDLVTSTVERIADRRETLGSSAYSFNLDARGEVLTLTFL